MKNFKGITYVGVDDLDLDLFEGQYVVPEGMSYNSYVITDEKIAVMDAVDKAKIAEWLGKLEDALQGRTPDYLVISQNILPPASWATRRCSRCSATFTAANFP